MRWRGGRLGRPVERRLSRHSSQSEVGVPSPATRFLPPLGSSWLPHATQLRLHPPERIAPRPFLHWLYPGPRSQAQSPPASASQLRRGRPTTAAATTPVPSVRGGSRRRSCSPISIRHAHSSATSNRPRDARSPRSGSESGPELHTAQALALRAVRQAWPSPFGYGPAGSEGCRDIARRAKSDSPFVDHRDSSPPPCASHPRLTKPSTPEPEWRKRAFICGSETNWPSGAARSSGTTGEFLAPRGNHGASAAIP